MTKYEIEKEKAREQIRELEILLSAVAYSYGELVEFQEKFAKLGKRYGLIKELKENGIL